MKPFVPLEYLAFSQAIDRVATIRKEQRREAGETLQPLLYAGRVPVKTITKNGTLIETPPHIWGGEQWVEALRFNKIKFPYGLGVSVSGRPVISRIALEAAFNPDGTVKEEPEPVAPEPTAAEVAEQPTRGRKRKWDWEGAGAHLMSIANSLDGLPETQADIERLVANWFLNIVGKEPAESAIRKHVSSWCQEVLGKASNSPTSN